ncbi:MAG: SDR family NAD(P)-dependent oxidoreductase [Anaerolineae bacterium]
MPTENPLAGKTALLTGATSGIGLRTLFLLAEQNVRILAIARDPLAWQRVERQLLRQIPGAQLAFFLVDLSLQKDTKRVAQEVGCYLDNQGLGLNLVLHVAGVYSSRQLTSEGIEVTLAVNHLAPFILNYELLPLIQRAKSRIITVTSASHHRTWLRPGHLNADCSIQGLWAYKLSKLANILATAEFNRRYAAPEPMALLLDPGLVNTDIGCKSTNLIERFIWDRRQRLGVDPQVPAHELVQLASLDYIPAKNEFYWHRGQPVTPSRVALDPVKALQVWRASCALCNIDLESNDEKKWNRL